MTGLLKIGYTCGPVDKRRRELSGATGVPAEFEADYFQLTDEVEMVEAKVHEELNEYRIAENREFFAAPLNKIIEAIERHSIDPVLRFRRAAEQVATRPSAYECRRCGHLYQKDSQGVMCPMCGF